MTTEMMDRAPEGLRSLYADDLGAPPFTVDDIVAAGRRRQKRRAVSTLGGAVAAVAAISVAATGLLGGAPTADLRPVRPAVTTPAVSYPGCASEPSTCAAVFAEWSREVTGSTSPVRTLPTGGFEKGSVVLAQRISASGAEQDVDLQVVLAPSTTAPESEGALNLIRNATALPGTGVIASRRTVSGKGRFSERFSVGREDFARALSVQVDLANHGAALGPYSRTSTPVQSPSWWTADTVADLVERIHGSASIDARKKGMVSSRGLPHVGCAPRPDCAGEMAQWSREVTGSTGTVDKGDSSAYEDGAEVLEQLVSVEPGKQQVRLSVVVARTSTKATGMETPPDGPDPVTLPGIPGVVDRLTHNGGGNFVQSYALPASRFGRAVEVTINVANQGPDGGPFSEMADDVRPPSWWTEANVADLVSRLYGTDTIREALANVPPSGTSTR